MCRFITYLQRHTQNAALFEEPQEISVYVTILYNVTNTAVALIEIRRA